MGKEPYPEPEGDKPIKLALPAAIGSLAWDPNTWEKYHYFTNQKDGEPAFPD